MKNFKLSSLAVPALLLAGLALGTGCAALGGAIETIGKAQGNSTLAGVGSSFKRSAEVDDFSEEEKVYTGRTVAADLLADSALSTNTDLEKYVGKVGQTVAQASGKATLPQGWHFILLKGDSVDAFAAPGGFILLTEGLVKECRDEDELAGVLAHEVAHVAFDHPMQAISAANKKAAVLSLISLAGDNLTKGDGGSGLRNQFSNVVNDVAKGVTQGYDRGKEKDADLEAVRVLVDLGYDPRGLERVLLRLKSGDHSHGNPVERAAAVEQTVVAAKPVAKLLAARTRRFKDAAGE